MYPVCPVGGNPAAVGVRSSIYSSAGVRYTPGDVTVTADNDGAGIPGRTPVEIPVDALGITGAGPDGDDVDDEGCGIGMRAGPLEAPRRGLVISRSEASSKISPAGSPGTEY
jgi:hypothetical protein